LENSPKEKKGDLCPLTKKTEGLLPTQQGKKKTPFIDKKKRGKLFLTFCMQQEGPPREKKRGGRREWKALRGDIIKKGGYHVRGRGGGCLKRSVVFLLKRVITALKEVITLETTCLPARGKGGEGTQ